MREEREYYSLVVFSMSGRIKDQKSSLLFGKREKYKEEKDFYSSECLILKISQI